MRQIGFRDFNVVPEDLIEAHLQRADSGALSLPSLDPRDHLLARLAQVAELVEIGPVAAPDQAALGQQRRRLRVNRLFEALVHVRQFVQPLVKLREPRSREMSDMLADKRQVLDRLFERQEVTSVRGFERHLAQEALEVLNLSQDAPELLARDDVPRQHFHGLQAGLDFLAMERRAQDPVFEQPRPERGHALVEHGEQRRGPVAAKHGLEQLEVAERGRVEHQGVALLVEPHAVEMRKRAALRLTHVVQDRARCGHRERMSVQPVTRQCCDAEVLAQKARAVVVTEDPVVEPGFGDSRSFRLGADGPGAVGRRSGSAKAGASAGDLASGDRAGPRGRPGGARSGHEHLARAHASEFLLETRARFGARELCSPKVAGGKIGEGEPNGPVALRRRGQIIVLARLEHLRVDSGAGRDHARHIPLHEVLRPSRVFHLVADGHAEALADQLGDISFRRMKRHAAHRDGDAFFLIARSQRDLQLASGDDRVLKEKLIEVPQAEQQKRVRVALLDAAVLAHQRSRKLTHKARYSSHYGARAVTL